MLMLQTVLGALLLWFGSSLGAYAIRVRYEMLFGICVACAVLGGVVMASGILGIVLR